MGDTCRATEAVHDVLGFIGESKKWVGVGGLGCPQVCMQLAPITHTQKIPLIAYDCASTGAADSHEYPDLVLFGKPALDAAKEIILQLANMNKWHHISFIEGNDLGYNQELEEIMYYVEDHTEVVVEK